MANHKSAIKKARQSQERRLRNRTVKTRVKTVTKKILQAVSEKSTDTIAADLKAAQSAIDKATKKGVLHHRTAARKISRLAKMANSTPS